jgi:Tol biopolymer transport system component
MKFFFSFIVSISLFSANGTMASTSLSIIKGQRLQDTIQYPEESHFKNIRQLTFGGDNAEAYFSYDGKYLVFQKTNPKEGILCDQIYFGTLPSSPNEAFSIKRISTGTGRTTCPFFLKDGKHILFASTHLGSADCPPVPDRTKYGNKYIWPLYADMDIFIADTSGKIVKQLTKTPGYDAEATLSPDGKKIIFTSVRDGDIDLYLMDLKTTQTTRITNTLGYDGGAFFSPDGKQLVFRASRPQTEEEIKEYKDYLSKGLVAPTNMEIYTCNIDGSNLKQVTNLGKANWAPFFHPKGKKIIFSSNHHSTKGYDFQLYMIDADGKNLERITNESMFNAFPMFSPDGKKLVFSSNRNNHGTRDTNLFLADWVE